MRENTKPATLFLCVAPDGKTDCVRIIRDRTGEDDFRRFIDSLLDASLQTDAPVPDDWVFRYIIPDGGLLPTLETGRDHSDYHHRLRHLDTLAELRPANVVALRNAALCRRSGIDPLSTEGSDRELVLGETEPRSFPSVRAVELAPNRVLLYDMSETVGCDAYRELAPAHRRPLLRPGNPDRNTPSVQSAFLFRYLRADETHSGSELQFQSLQP